MANWLFLKNQIAQTAKCELRYRKPLPINETVFLRVDASKRGANCCDARFSHPQKIKHIVAESNAKFMVIKS
ncbi:MAG: hypothetical protein Ct9H300mP4_03860 [Gammaproteobacteria bacterium]|nr:MAG: hypothetical protein Ct9H300mP4_03860 [Gammaproteobacteria bacterium]